jgi:IclR family transcriptional regulator, KDG regulon repressor
MGATEALGSMGPMGPMGPTGVTRGAESGERSGPSGYTIAVLGRALDLLDVLAGERAVSLTEASRRAGVNKVTAFRILANFEQRGYVEREPLSGHYRLGLRLLQLGTLLGKRLDLRTVARPHLEALRQALGETVNLALPGTRGIVYIDILECAHDLRMAATVGAEDGYHCTALGKAMLAAWPEGEREALLRRVRLRRKTGHTRTDRRALRRELGVTRERGYAVDDEENEVGARCVGAAVLDAGGRVVGGISVSGPASRLTAESVPAAAREVLRAAQAVTRAMGG